MFYYATKQERIVQIYLNVPYISLRAKVHVKVCVCARYVCVYWLREIVSWVIYCAYERASISRCLVVSRISRDLSSVLWMCSRIPRPSPQYLWIPFECSECRTNAGRFFCFFIERHVIPSVNISEYVYIYDHEYECVYILK